MHEQVVGPDELQGMALNKSIESVLARVENRVAYEMIEDVFDLLLVMRAVSQLVMRSMTVTREPRLRQWILAWL
ncbi:MAG: hypothetical protein OXH82_05460 [Candidatus Dadabacteria bacterium]|nr:hypothetical protein [Candidatus Dadabacteria bacterium]MDE0663353.1 hypothetical protein [Candidatus Dadabacteria bacterium]